MITVLADKNIPSVNHFLPDDADISFFDPNQPLTQIPQGIQALLIRTITKINRETFPTLPSSLEFIGTASSGTDHVDKQYLAESNIAFASAAGCNARSVAEYVATALLLWKNERNYDLENLNVGIVGAGHTGTAVQNLLKQLNVKAVAYDPPREEREPDFQSASLEEVLECDILTFHTPLTSETDYPTFHWLDEKKLDRHEFKLIINASRGGIVDEQSLINAHKAKKVEHFVLDVWENEPAFNDETARRAYIKTPHIAGYSYQAKQNASKMVSEALVQYFGINTSVWGLESPSQSKQAPPKLWSLIDILSFYHPILDYETRFRMLIGRNSEAKRKGVGTIRTGHKLRDEFRYLKPPKHFIHKFPELKKLGFGTDG